MIFRKCILWILLLSLIFPVSTVAAAPAPDEEWVIIAPGIEYRKFQLPDPNNVFVVRMDRSNLGVTLESSIATGKIAEGRETVSSMVARYDQALSYWGATANPSTWGMRNQVVVGINGSYFDWNNGLPQGGQVYSGWYSKRFDKLGGWSGFAWKLDRSAFIGECVFHRPEKQIITYQTGITQPITRVNDTRAWNELVLFTPQWNTRTGTDNTGLEVVIEMERPTMILPNPSFARGFVRQIRNNQGNSLIPFNSIVLSAHGSAAEILLANVQVGDEIHVSQEITSYESDCSTPYPLSWTKTFASVQGAFFYLKNGQVRDFNSDVGATTRQPRTAIAYNNQYIFFLVVDGRDSLHSLGMSIHELALFTRDTLGAAWGVAQDGGGSSTMVINGQVINNTYCNNYSCMGEYKTFLPMVSRDSHTGQSVAPTEADIIRSAAGIERAVANGMLMVIVQPETFSSVYKPGDTVITTSEIELRLGPGTNYDSFTTFPAGTHGSIAEQMNGLDGVQAKSTYWWYVDFGGIKGWVPEGALANHAAGGALLDGDRAGSE